MTSFAESTISNRLATPKDALPADPLLELLLDPLLELLLDPLLELLLVDVDRSGNPKLLLRTVILFFPLLLRFFVLATRLRKFLSDERNPLFNNSSTPS